MPASLQTSTGSSPASTAHPLPPRSVAGALAALSMSMLLASLGTSGANIALPTLARSFSASFQAVQWVVLAYLLAVTTMLVGAGRLGDLLGRRRLLLSGLALFTAASLLGGLAPTLPVLIAARGAQGLGAAAMMALAMSLIGAAATPERTGGAMGLLGTMSAVGTALGPSLGGVLIASSGWRALFLINVPLGLLVLWLVHRYVERDAPAPRTSAKFDLVGTVLLASSLGAFALTMTVGHGRLSGANVLLFAVATIGALLFLHQQSTAMAPLVPAPVLRNRSLGMNLATNAIVSCVMMSTLIVGPFYLSNTMALTPGLMGLVMTVGPVLTAVTGVPGGQLVDKRGAYRASLAGLLAMLIGCALLAALPPALGLAGYLIPIAFLTIGYALFQAANNTAVMAQAQHSARGVVSGVLGLSRNLGLITGASLMGGVFAAASGVTDMVTADAAATATGMHQTFALAAALILAAGVLAATRRTPPLAPSALVIIALLAHPVPSRAQPAREQRKDGVIDPYPAVAAGWGPQYRQGVFASRWAEDWTARRTRGLAPPLKAVPLGQHAAITLSAELRARHDDYHNARLTAGNSFPQDLLRATGGADLRLTSHARFYSELTSGQVNDRRRESSASLQNDLSLQQAFLDVRSTVHGSLVGSMLGRQEFADGPRQLVSLSDGPNVHRTWNGVRLYVHGARARIGTFDLRVTRPGRGAFDESTDRGERLQGINGSVVLRASPTNGHLYLDPFWIRSDHPAARAGGVRGRDRRDTYGTRLWARGGAVSIDVTAAMQRGTHDGRRVDAWGVFAVHSLAVSPRGWRPRLDVRVDVASGGGTEGNGALRAFNPLYASTGYLSEGQMLSLSNLVLITPGITIAPAPSTLLTLEYGFANRYSAIDPVRGGGMRPYHATRDARGAQIGGLARANATRSLGQHASLFFTIESLDARPTLERGQVASARYLQLGSTLRY